MARAQRREDVPSDQGGCGAGGRAGRQRGRPQVQQCVQPLFSHRLLKLTAIFLAADPGGFGKPCNSRAGWKVR